jgi:tape measure domain-containing protein
MELAKLFATVGFKVDKDGLTEFRKEMASLKGDLKEAAIQTGKLKNQLTGLTAQFKSFQKMTDTKGVTKWMDGIEKSITHLNNMQVAVGGQAERSTHWADAFSSSIFKLHQAITGRKNEIAEYAQAIMLLAANFERLKAATAGVSRFRQVPRSAISEGQGGYGGAREGAGRPRGGGNGYESNQYVGYWGRASGIAKSPMAAMLRPMLPTGMGLFNAVAGGYAFKELVATGREMMVMENMLKAISGDTQTFNSNLKFVKETADELGISILDMGQSYSKMFMSGKDHFGTDVLQKSFKGAQSYFRLLGMSSEKINLANKAIEQMFNKQKVSSEELKGQLGEHAAGVMQYFAQAAGTDVQGLFKMMENGQVGTDVVVKAMQTMGAFAQGSPEFQKQLKMSAAAQERFNNRMRDFAKVMMEGGLDEALTSLFKMLSKLLDVLTPVAKGVAWVVKKLAELIKIMWDNQAVVAFTIAVTMMAASLGLAGGAAYRSMIMLRWWTMGVWSAHAATIKLTATITAFLYIFKSIDEYLNGESNWVTDVEEALTFLMISIENVGLRIQSFWLDLEYSAIQSFRNIGNAFLNTPGIGHAIRAVNATGTVIGEAAGWVHENVTVTGAGDLYKPDVPVKPSTPAGLEKPSSMNFNINFNEMPTSAKEALQRGDIKEFGIGIGQGLRVGGLGIYS